MDKLVFKQFKMTRGYFIKNVESLSKDIVNVQPDGFNNTIQWHIGHVLTVAEQFMLGFPHKTTHLPANYIELFGNGTKPADWEEDVPTVDKLIIELKDQLVRLQQIPAERLNETLEKPFMGLETFGELAGLTLMHEANHLGQIQAMKRIIEHTGVKN
ncbi:DinB family protein [Bacillus multifaciens]|uniref:DinB family protein n=1 Tax=Bacillus multifaciens TaxID=3068506 RepID=UPI0027411AC7|nr:DinB family protein [Bacillus sp. WLY-B-L8]MDP7978712.1 DinB family protein [Bacillus sp. WLY-B-L8]